MRAGQLLLTLVTTACTALVTETEVDAGLADVRGRVQTPSNVDLLVVVDNSTGGLWTVQFRGAEGVAAFAETLFAESDDFSHERVPMSLHVGVVSTDLGAVDTSWALCTDRHGDDAALNPARYGASQRRRGREGFPNPLRPRECLQVDQDPAWFSVDGMRDSVASFATRIGCVMNLGNYGCEFKQPLEVVHRRFQIEDDERRGGGASAGERFLRDDSVVVIVVFSRDDDGSFRDCSRGSADDLCDDASDVSRRGSTRWFPGTSVDRVLRATPCSVQDPTWALDRYHHPRDPTRGYLPIRPGHPEHVLFAAFAGVPSFVSNLTVRPEWEALLGMPGADADDFCGRRTESAVTGVDAAGPFTMRPGVPIDCPTRVMPACRMSTPVYARDACEMGYVFVAHPARRLVEIARRFDEAPLCSGRPCRNGFVTSVCQDDYRPAFRALARRVRQRLAGSVE